MASAQQNSESAGASRWLLYVLLSILPTMAILLLIVDRQGVGRGVLLRDEHTNLTALAATLNDSFNSMNDAFNSALNNALSTIDTERQKDRKMMTNWRKKVQSNFEEMQSRMTALHEGLQEVAVPEQSPSTRSLVFDTAWGKLAMEKLQEWRSTLFRRTSEQYTREEKEQTQGGTKITGVRIEPPGWKRYDIANPIMDCPYGDIQRVGGDGDGGKFLCMEGILNEPGCIVYSLGSNGQYEFEMAMLKDTDCDVHTFDCTYVGESLDGNKRHFYHEICLGNVKKMVPQGDGDFMEYLPYPDLLERVGHTGKRISLLKIDVEGYEFDALSGMKESEGCSLPIQISMEVHYQNMYNLMGGARVTDQDFTNLLWPRHSLSLGEIANWFMHFANLGYALVSREDNPYGPNCCAEFTMIKVEQPGNCMTTSKVQNASTNATGAATPVAPTPAAPADGSTPAATPEGSSPAVTPESSTPAVAPEGSTPTATPEGSSPAATPAASTSAIPAAAFIPGDDPAST